jgi:hypothetical protein
MGPGHLPNHFSEHHFIHIFLGYFIKYLMPHDFLYKWYMLQFQHVVPVWQGYPQQKYGETELDTLLAFCWHAYGPVSGFLLNF